MTVMEKETINSDWLELVLERSLLKRKTEEESKTNKKKGGGWQTKWEILSFLPQGDETIHTILCKLISLSVKSDFLESI